MLNHLQVAPATTAELEIVLEILAEAAQWLQANKIDQWAYPPPPSLRQRIRREIEKGELYLAHTVPAGQAVGTLRFEWAGDALWHAQPAHTAGYLHTIAIRPALHGHSLGEELINWAKDHVRSRNCNFLRLDCVAANAKLRSYYTRLGFRYCGQATHEDFTGALFELVL